MRLLFLLTLWWPSLLVLVFAQSTQRAKFNFNSGWRVKVTPDTGLENPSLNDSSWKAVTLPYAWNEDEAFRLDIANLSTGIAWYRKRFQLPAGSTGKKIFLEFEGIRQGGEFYLNGQWIGRSENGVMAFGLDVSSVVEAESENVIAARIDNSWDYREVATNTRYQWSDRNFNANYGGINKNVFIHITDQLYQTLPLYSNLGTTGVYVYAQNHNVEGKSAKITAESQVKNEHSEARTFSYNVVVEDKDGKQVATFNAPQQTLQPNATGTISATAQVGNLNFWSWGFGYLYNVHTTLLVNGQAVDKVTTRTGFRKTEFARGMFKLNDRTVHLKGYAQRTTNEWVALGSAVPAWLSDFSNSLVLKSNGNLIRWMHITPWKQDIESLDRLGIMQALPAGDSENDSSGRQWEQRVELMRDAVIYNKNNPSVIFYEAGNEAISEAHMTEMVRVRDTYDRYGGRAAGCREMLDSTVAEYGGEMLYINKDNDIPFWSMEYSRDEGLRKFWDEFSPPFHPDGEGPPHDGEDASAYNRNQDSHAVENVVRWFDYYEMRPGTGERVNSGGVNIIFSDSNTHHRGAENYRRSGEVDAVRLPKDAWYAHQVMWDNWVDIEKYALHLVGHWNYAADTTKDVFVISTAEAVELFLNGKSLGWGSQEYRFLYTFPDVAYEAGELKAVGYDASGKEVASDVHKTAGAAAAIRLTVLTSPAGFFANGNDIALVDVEVIDSNGQRNPIALNPITFSLSGEATWRGGIAQGADNYILATTLPVENGVNRVLLRSTTKPGSITLSATSQGLSAASITLTTQAFNSTNGLATRLPAESLPLDLSRGPTPAGESYTVKRRTLHVASATAGANAATIGNTYDSNELSGWVSGTSLSTAWAEYEFVEGSDVRINTILAKFNSHRTASYDIEVRVGNTSVWRGRVPPSLGYATISFNATTLAPVRVLATSGELKIQEIEFYSPL